jgi:hypothetical protein
MLHPFMLMHLVVVVYCSLWYLHTLLPYAVVIRAGHLSTHSGAWIYWKVIYSIKLICIRMLNHFIVRNVFHVRHRRHQILLRHHPLVVIQTRRATIPLILGPAQTTRNVLVLALMLVRMLLRYLRLLLSLTPINCWRLFCKNKPVW